MTTNKRSFTVKRRILSINRTYSRFNRKKVEVNFWETKLTTVPLSIKIKMIQMTSNQELRIKNNAKGSHRRYSAGGVLHLRQIIGTQERKTMTMKNKKMKRKMIPMMTMMCKITWN
jgi:hypothetical protein